MTATPPPGRKPGLRPERARPRAETEPYGAFVRRAIRAYGRRIGEGEIEELAGLLELHALIDAVAAEAVRELRAEPNAHAWQAIADAVGLTRQGAMLRWPRAGGARRRGGQPAHLR